MEGGKGGGGGGIRLGSSVKKAFSIVEAAGARGLDWGKVRPLPPLEC